MHHAFVTAAVAGVLAHQVIFKHGEWHMQAPLLCQLFGIGTSAVMLIVSLVKGPVTGVTFGSAIASIFTSALFASMLVYRCFFHRLRQFPGPTLARASKFWHVWNCIKSGSQNHMVLDGLHKKYGDFVRTGMPPLITCLYTSRRSLTVL